MGILKFFGRPGVKQISVEEFVPIQRSGCYLIDVREKHEYAGGHVPGARSFPLTQLSRRAQELPRDREIHVICASGHRSRVGARILGAAGVEATSVAGGTAAWAHRELPLVKGPRPN
ncbi:MAG: rhodanese-like domain-containing protein [Candidatus Dormibacteria bacterium]|jgi:rhodanese-related sulfurtransferase